MEKRFLLLFPTILIALLYLRVFPLNPVPKVNNIPKDSIVTIRIAAAGDLMCHSPETTAAKVSVDSFDFTPMFRYVKKYLQDADLTIGNLETVTAGKDQSYSGYPKFNSPDQFIDGVRNAGFNFVTTSNNHALDRGEFGVRRTIDELIKYNLNYTGTFTSREDRDSVRIFNIKGIRIALLSYSYGTNGNPIPNRKKYLINVIDTSLIREDILRARNGKAELVLVYFHFGEEYKREPVEFQKIIVKKTEEMGADIILGGHPHVIEPAVLFKTTNAKLDTGFVIYSLGNFLSNQSKRFTDAGVVLYLNISKNLRSGSIWISGVEFIPTWVYKGITEKSWEYFVLPGKDSLQFSFLPKPKLDYMQTVLEDTKYILTLYHLNATFL